MWENTRQLFPRFVVYKPQLLFFCRGPFALPEVGLHGPFVLRCMGPLMHLSSAALASGNAPKFSKGSTDPPLPATPIHR